MPLQLIGGSSFSVPRCIKSDESNTVDIPFASEVAAVGEMKFMLLELTNPIKLIFLF